MFYFFLYKIISNKIYREVYILENKNIIIYIFKIIIIFIYINMILKFSIYLY